MSPIIWRSCECGNALVFQDDDRCQTCEAAYQRDYAYYKGLFEAERGSRHDAEGLRVRTPVWRGGEE